jgi:hypothetical protein
VPGVVGSGERGMNRSLRREADKDRAPHLPLPPLPLADEVRCPAANPDGYHCTLPDAHAGNHVARGAEAGSGLVLDYFDIATWPQADDETEPAS